MRYAICAIAAVAVLWCGAGRVMGQSIPDRYLDYTGLPDQLSGGSRMIPVQTPKGTFHVWVKRIGNNKWNSDVLPCLEIAEDTISTEIHLLPFFGLVCGVLGSAGFTVTF